MTTSENRHGYFLEQLTVGQCASIEKAFSEQDVLAYARLSEDDNPLHLDRAFAQGTRAGEPIVHGMLTASLISALVGTRLPGPGCLWMAQDMKFLQPVKTGQRVTAMAEIVEIDTGKQRVRMGTVCWVGSQIVIDGWALVWVPRRSDQTSVDQDV